MSRETGNGETVKTKVNRDTAQAVLDGTPTSAADLRLLAEDWLRLTEPKPGRGKHKRIPGAKKPRRKDSPAALRHARALELHAQGLTNRAIAERLGYSEGGVSGIVCRENRRLGLENRKRGRQQGSAL